MANGLKKGDEHPTYTPHGAWHILPFLQYTAGHDDCTQQPRRICNSTARICDITKAMLGDVTDQRECHSLYAVFYAMKISTAS